MTHVQETYIEHVQYIHIYDICDIYIHMYIDDIYIYMYNIYIYMYNVRVTPKHITL